MELLAYLQIARDDGHLIDRQNTEEVCVRTRAPSERDLHVTVPLVYFMLHKGGHMADLRQTEAPEFRDWSIAAVRLLQGVIYSDDAKTWDILLRSDPRWKPTSLGWP